MCSGDKLSYYYKWSDENTDIDDEICNISGSGIAFPDILAAYQFIEWNQYKHEWM